MRPGKFDKFVTLSRAPQTPGDSDGFFEALSPATAWVALEPLQPFESDGTRTQGFYVSMRYHDGVTVDTRIVYGSREFYVKGVQNVNEKNRELRLYCEEVAP